MDLKKKRRIMGGASGALLFLLAFTVFFQMNFRTVQVSGPSMLPTYHSGQRVLVSSAYWLVGDIKQGDVVVISREEGEFIIKRVNRLAGEKVEFKNAPTSHKIELGPYVVPKDMIYVLGDNRKVSEDSRLFGPVEVKKVIGKVVIGL